MIVFCRECGKQMEPNPGWLGTWICPDSRLILSDSPPYKRKCNGFEISDEGVKAFEDECLRQWSERN